MVSTCLDTDQILKDLLSCYHHSLNIEVSLSLSNGLKEEEKGANNIKYTLVHVVYTDTYHN